MIVGVTGKYCSGKDTAVKIFLNKGFSQINVDKLGHTVLEEQKETVINRFGRSIVNGDNSINRKALGNIVFGNKRAMKDLEALLHPAMILKVKELIKSTDSNTVINAAILFKMGLHKLCDYIFIIKASFLKRLKRARLRDSLTCREALSRLFSQRKPRIKGIKIPVYKIYNNNKQVQLVRKIEDILEEIA